MEVATVFALSLVGGYLFAAHWRYTSYAIRRSEGQHLYFRAAFYAIAWFIAAFLLRIILLVHWEDYASLEKALTSYIAPALKDPSNERQVELVVTALYSCVVGPAIAVLLNGLTPRVVALRQRLSAMDLLLFNAQRAGLPVQVTLSSGKVYIGAVRRIRDPERPPETIALFPMYSGHRGDDGRLQITTDYEEIYKGLSDPQMRAELGIGSDFARYFDLELRADLIISAEIFTPQIYSQFNPGWRDAIGKRKVHPTLTIEILQKPRIRVPTR